MSGGQTSPTSAEAYDRLFRAKARAELEQADALARGSSRVSWSGDEIATVALVKGTPGEADTRAGHALAGPDGEAAHKALDALGLAPERFAICSRVGKAGAAARAKRLRLAIEAVDPRIVVALDGEAAADLAAAFGLDSLGFGTPVSVGGRRFLAVDGLEASLADEKRKRLVWRQLKTLKTTG